MPVHPLTKADLDTFRQRLSTSFLRSDHLLDDLRSLYLRFYVNQEEIIRLKYQADLHTIEAHYLKEKEVSQEQYATLKSLYKQIDHRIAAIEQKLSNGIPDNLSLMDKLIAEQEAIVAEQEQLNAAEAELTSHTSIIDVGHGKKLSKLEQDQQSEIKENELACSAVIREIDHAAHQSRRQTNLIAVLPVVFLPALLDLLASRFNLYTQTISHSIIGHYVFLISLALILIFLLEPLKERIFSWLAHRYATKSFAQLMAKFEDYTSLKKSYQL